MGCWVVYISLAWLFGFSFLWGCEYIRYWLILINYREPSGIEIIVSVKGKFMGVR